METHKRRASKQWTFVVYTSLEMEILLFFGLKGRMDTSLSRYRVRNWKLHPIKISKDSPLIFNFLGLILSLVRRLAKRTMSIQKFSLHLSLSLSLHMSLYYHALRPLPLRPCLSLCIFVYLSITHTHTHT